MFKSMNGYLTGELDASNKRIHELEQDKAMFTKLYDASVHQVKALESQLQAHQQALKEAIRLCHVPEHMQDDEWQASLERISSVLGSKGDE